jgi:hypothetical protein
MRTSYNRPGRASAGRARHRIPFAAGILCASFVGAATLPSACGKRDSGAPAAAASTIDDKALTDVLFLDAEDLAEKNDRILTDAEVTRALNGLPDVYNAAPQADADDVKGGCLLTELDEAKIRVNGNVLWFEYEREADGCDASAEEKFGAIDERAVFAIGCVSPAVDFSTLAGKSLGKARAAVGKSFCTDGSEERVVAQMENRYTRLDEFGEKASTERVVDSRTAKDFTPCVRRGATLVDGCTRSALTVVVDFLADEATTHLVTLAEGKGLKAGKRPQRFFDAGTLDVVLGDWKGTFTFGAADEPPAYRFTRSGEVVRGEFDPEKATAPLDDELLLSRASTHRRTEELRAEAVRRAFHRAVLLGE